MLLVPLSILDPTALQSRQRRWGERILFEGQNKAILRDFEVASPFVSKYLPVNDREFVAIAGRGRETNHLILLGNGPATRLEGDGPLSVHDKRWG